MLRRFLILSFFFFGFMWGANERYVCPLDDKYPEFLAGTITIDQINNYTSRSECKKNCIKRDTCSISQVVATPIEVMGIINGKIEQGDIDIVNKKVSITKFSGLNITSTTGTLLFSFEGDTEMRESLLFETFSNAELVKVGIYAIVGSNSFSLGSYDNSISINVEEGVGALKIVNGAVQTRIELGFNSNGDKITTKNGAVSNGWLTYQQMLSAVGVTLKSNNTILNMEEYKRADENGNTSYIDIAISGGRGELLFENNQTKKREMVLGDKKIAFVSKGLVDTQGNRSVSYQIEITETIDGQESVNTYADNYRITLLQGGGSPYYYCDTHPDIVGDLGDNKFSSQEACNQLCVGQQDCFNQMESENITLDNGCRIVESVLYEPITSAEGKTFYMSKKITTECEVTERKKTGCEEWETKEVAMPNLNSVLGMEVTKLETNEKDFDFSKAVSVFGTMNALESAGHIFSGEGNHCDYGTWYDEPNWVELRIKWATAIIGSVAGSLSSGVESVSKVATTAGGTSFTSAQSAMSTMMEKWIEKGIQASQELMNNFITSAVTEAVKIVVDGAYAIDEAIKKQNEEQNRANQTALVTGGTSIGNNISDSEANKIAKNYAECMTKLGLSYDLISNWQMSIEYENEWGNTSILDESYKHPILMTPQEVYMLKKTCENEAGVTIEEKDKYFYARYSLKSVLDGDETMIEVYPISATDRIIAGEVICGGIDQLAIIREKYSARFLNPKYSEPSVETLMAENGYYDSSKSEPLPDAGETEDSGSGEKKEWTDKKIATESLQMLNSLVPAPWNMIGMAVLDLVDMFDTGNTCKDLEFAEERGDKEAIKTYKRKDDGLCVFVETEVVWKVADTTARERDHYCCYDSASTKAFALGITKQLGLKLTKDNCSPLTLEHIKQANFSPCKAGQDPYRDKCFPTDHFEELKNAYIQGASIGVDGMIQSLIENMFKLEQQTSK